MAGTPEYDPRAATGPVEGTRLESVEEIRQAVRSRRPATAKEAPGESDTMPFRPVRRPPMALLCILDDGDRDDGEWVRLRSDRVVIGRVEGDIVIPHDTMMSGRHAELTRQLENGRFRWYLTDLQSTNGTYIRVGNAHLKHNQEMLIGSRCYRFDAAPQGAALADATESEDEQPVSTRGWQSLSAADLIPALIELTPKGEGQRHLLTRADNWIGRNPTTCSVVLGNDPFVSPQHVRIHKDSRGRWHIESAKSLNGLWLRIDQAPLEGACQFQLGEQRFLLRVL